MNHRCSALVLGSLALGAVTLTTTEASAYIPDEPPTSKHNVPYNYPEYKLPDPVPPTVLAATASGDDTRAEVAQSGTSALGGVALTLGGLWLYRRRHTAAI